MQFIGYEKFQFLTVIILLVVFFSTEKLICLGKTKSVLLLLLVIYNTIQCITYKMF